MLSKHNGELLYVLCYVYLEIRVPSNVDNFLSGSGKFNKDNGNADKIEE